MCAYSGHILELKRLIDLGIDLNLQDSQGRTALHLAVAGNRRDVVSVLLYHDVKLLKDFQGRTPFEEAPGNSIIAKMIANKYNLDTSNSNPKAMEPSSHTKYECD